MHERNAERVLEQEPERRILDREERLRADFADDVDGDELLHEIEDERQDGDAGDEPVFADGR